MKLTRRAWLGRSAGILGYASPAYSQPPDQLPSWNDGPAKRRIMDFVHATTLPSSPKFVPLENRIAVFDQDGTLWTEHPLYTQVVYCLEHVAAVVKARPDLANEEPFKTVMAGNRDAIAKLAKDDIVKILAATLTGMSVDDFQAQVKQWLLTARDSRWNRPYTKLTYAPMLELIAYLLAAAGQGAILAGQRGPNRQC